VSAGVPARRTARAFTLIEVLAVVAILALTAMLVTPNLAVLRERRVGHAAQRLAAEIELARQRAVVTGIPHRVFFDLDAGVYRLEWLGAESESELLPVAADVEYDLGGGSGLDLVAPQTTAFEFTPLPDSFGNYKNLDGEVYVAALETAEGLLESGQAAVSFERDGTAAYTEIILEEPGGVQRRLAVLPLDDAVRFVDAEAQ
jgi:prepilin-type N-terminal cleavage/methylation domain-containing protein